MSAAGGLGRDEAGVSHLWLAETTETAIFIRYIWIEMAWEFIKNREAD